MTVTIAIPYSSDAAPFVERAVRSALAQTHKDTRVVVVGDGAAPPLNFTDPRLVVHTLDRNHGGAPFAQQVALLATPDEWYAPLGADDWLEPDHIERLLAEGKDAVATGLVFWHVIRNKGGEERYEGIRKTWYETGLFRSACLRAFGGYDVTEKSGQDNCVLWLLEVYGGLTVRGGPPTYHRVKRLYGSVSVNVWRTKERKESDSRTAVVVAAAKTRTAVETASARIPRGDLAEELHREVEVLSMAIDEMVIPEPGIDALVVSTVWDPAGIGVRYGRASSPSLRVRAAHRNQTYLDYPVDILWNAKTDAVVRQLAARADVVHVNIQPGAYTLLGLDRLQKPVVLQHHGSAYRRETAMLHAQARRYGMLEAVSTIDLLRFDEDLTWLPAPYNVAELAEIGREHRRVPDGRIRIVQTPTSRPVKSTAKLEAAVRMLKAEGLPIDLVLGEKIPWQKALALKATADIFFDQVQLGYGCSAIEAWCMGIPVIAGGDAWTEARMREEFGTDDLPFYRAEDTEASIRDAIRALALSEDLRVEYGARGLAHAQRFHDEEPALRRLTALYERALDPTRRPKPTPGRPGNFRCTRYPALFLRLEGETFKFAGGRLRVREGDRADLVRLHALSSPQSGIVEEIA